MKKTLGLLIIIFIFPILVHAENNCSTEELLKYKSAASNIEVFLKEVKYIETLTETDMGEDITVEKSFFNVIIDNVFDDSDYTILVNGLASYYTASELKESPVIYSNIDDSIIKKISIEVNSTKCNNYLLRTFSITIPKYNMYYETLACQNNPDFYLCDKYLYTDYNTTTGIGKEIDKFVKGQIDDKGEEVKKESFFDKLLKFIKNNKIILIVIAVLLTGFLIYQSVKAYRKRKLSGF